MYRIALAFLLVLMAFDLRAETPWLEISRLITEYAANPSPATAGAALSAIPESPVLFSASPHESEANQAIYVPSTMQALKRLVLMKERESVALALRMRNIADGAFLEDLDIILGQLIRPAPELFLAEVQHAKVSRTAMRGLVGNLGDAFVDQTERQCMELTLREKALASVAQPSLSETKKQALAALTRDASFCKERGRQ